MLAGVPRQPDTDPAAIAALLRRAFGASTPIEFDRTADGTSTQVYRVFRGDDVFYLRLAEERDEDAHTDAVVHRELLRRGVPVPDIVYVERFDPAIDRSAMITTAIAGGPLSPAAPVDLAAAVVRAAGAACARINQVAVQGFGWVRRDGSPVVSAKLSSYAEFVRSELPAVWPGLLGDAFTAVELDRLHYMVEDESDRSPAAGSLVHGDLDLTHIFTDGNAFTGIIDFGEIRGAEMWYDLGHFQLHDCAMYPRPLLDEFVAGYCEVVPLPADYPELIRRSAVLSGLRQLCRWLGRGLADEPMVKERVMTIRTLLRG
jgi:Ser/Thr protein kinase RdoA (MazF antagonist)